MAGIGALVAVDLEDALGAGVLHTICAGVVALVYLLVVYVKRNPQKWRK
jgi:O-antigen/teichoic acid export membrane protein